MILYTIYDPNTIFQNCDYLNMQSSSQGYTEMEIEGVMVQVSQGKNDGLRIERILSSNPLDYLNPKLQPGSMVQK